MPFSVSVDNEYLILRGVEELKASAFGLLVSPIDNARLDSYRKDEI